MVQTEIPTPRTRRADGGGWESPPARCPSVISLSRCWLTSASVPGAGDVRDEEEEEEEEERERERITHEKQGRGSSGTRGVRLLQACVLAPLLHGLYGYRS